MRSQQSSTEMSLIHVFGNKFLNIVAYFYGKIEKLRINLKILFSTAFCGINLYKNQWKQVVVSTLLIQTINTHLVAVDVVWIVH